MPRFAVVHFLDENSLSVVPESWLDGDDKCYWPPIRSHQKIASLVKTSALPELHWKKDKVRVMYQTDDYNKACEKERQAQDESDLQSDFASEAEVVSQQKNKRKLIDNESSSDDDISVRSQFPAPPPKKPNFSRFSEVPLSKKYSSPTSVSTPNSSSLLASKESVFQKKVFKMMEDIKMQIAELKEMIQTSSKINLPKLPSDCLSLPIDSTEDLGQFDSYLETQKNFLSVCEYLGTIGGNDIKDCARRALGRLITNQLSQQYNWKGSRGTKLAFSVFRNINRLIFGVVRKNFNTTEVEVQGCIKNWLMHAKDRDGGRSARQNNNMDLDASHL